MKHRAVVGVISLVAVVLPLLMSASGASTASPAAPAATSLPSACTLKPIRHSPAVRAIHRRLAAAATSKVRLLALGSSTTYGMDLSSPSQRWTDQFMDGLASRGLAATPGSFGPVSAQALAQGPGAIMINGAIPGATAETSLAEYAPGLVTALATGNMPSIVLHMTGANDYWLQVPPAVYGAGLRATMAALDLQPVKPIQVLISPYRDPATKNPGTPWSKYRAQMRQIAAADPTHVVFVDLTGWFNRHQVPGADPAGILDAGGVHPSAAGQQMIAELVLRALRFGC